MVFKRLVLIISASLCCVILLAAAPAHPLNAALLTPTPSLEPTATPLPGAGLLTPLTPEADMPIEQLAPEVISVRPHDTGSFTQGLLLHNGLFYESAGEYGESNLREVDPQTGKVLRQYSLKQDIFAEGLALVGEKLFQITWTNGYAIVYDLKKFEPLGAFQYAGEGWGLCYDGERLWMSDGSHKLVARDPETFQVTFNLVVRYAGLPVDELNELECVGDSVYANVWYTDYILRINKFTGRVTARIDASSLLTPDERAALPSGAVLNGIAYDAKNDTFFVTGKRWPKLFEVRFKPK
jgi:glutamine cyclotransferase